MNNYIKRLQKISLFILFFLIIIGFVYNSNAMLTNLHNEKTNNIQSSNGILQNISTQNQMGINNLKDSSIHRGSLNPSYSIPLVTNNNFFVPQMASVTGGPTGTQGLISHSPITITSNNDFASLGFPGDGSSTNPYLIDSLSIVTTNLTLTTVSLISISNTDAYFIISNNYLNGVYGTINGITFDNVTHGTISSNTIINNYNGIVINGSSNDVIFFNTISLETNNGIFLNGSSTISISNNAIFQITNSGIFLQDSNYNSIAANTIYNIGVVLTLIGSQNMISSTSSLTGGYGVGLYIDPSVYNNIDKNIIFNSTTEGILLYQSEFTSIIGNNINHNGVNGIFFQNANHNSIANNAITFNGQSSNLLTTVGSRSSVSSFTGGYGVGLYIDPSVDNNVTGNIISNNGAVGAYLSYSNNTMISNNNVDSNGATGIFFENANENTVTGNSITNNGAGTATLQSLSGSRYSVSSFTGGYGVGLYIDPSVDNNVTGNVISNNNLNGVYLLQSNNTNISNNEVNNNGVTGILLQNVSLNTISANDISNNGFSTLVGAFIPSSLSGGYGVGLYIDPSGPNLVSGNHIFNNSDYGVYTVSSTGTTIDHNIFTSNGLYGVFFDSGSSSNLVTLNDFFGNNPLGSSQAYDDGISNTFSTNFWSDGTPGQPYHIDGNANNTDPTPSPVPINLLPNQFLTPPRILYPNGEEKVNGIKYIHWKPSFSSLRYHVTYSVYYSSNDGSSWNLLASGLTTNKYLWNTTALPNGNNYLVKVLANDGHFLIVQSTSRHPFRIQNHPPNNDDYLIIGGILGCSSAIPIALVKKFKKLIR